MLERINLVPQPTRADRIKQTVPYLSLGVLMVGVAILGGYYWQLQGQDSQVSAEVKALELRNEQLESQQMIVQQLALDMKRLKADEAGLQQEVAQLQKIPKQKKQYSNLLTIIAQVLPSTIRCEKIILDEKGGRIIGEAMQYRDLPRFVKELGDRPDFRSVSLQMINQKEQEKSGLFAFTLSFEL